MLDCFDTQSYPGTKVLLAYSDEGKVLASGQTLNAVISDLEEDGHTTEEIVTAIKKAPPYIWGELEWQRKATS
jgi:hypothetical protein